MIRASQGLWESHLGRESPWLLPMVLSICLAQSRQQRQLSYFNTLLLPTLKCAVVNGNIPANSAGQAYKELAVLLREEMQFCFRQCVSVRCVCVCVMSGETVHSDFVFTACPATFRSFFLQKHSRYKTKCTAEVIPEKVTGYFPILYLLALLLTLNKDFGFLRSNICVDKVHFCLWVHGDNHMNT